MCSKWYDLIWILTSVPAILQLVFFQYFAQLFNFFFFLKTFVPVMTKKQYKNHRNVLASYCCSSSYSNWVAKLSHITPDSEHKGIRHRNSYCYFHLKDLKKKKKRTNKHHIGHVLCALWCSVSVGVQSWVIFSLQAISGCVFPLWPQESCLQCTCHIIAPRSPY